MIKLFALIVPEEAHSPDLLENPTIRSVLKRPSGTSHSKVSEETHPGPLPWEQRGKFKQTAPASFTSPLVHIHLTSLF